MFFLEWLYMYVPFNWHGNLERSWVHFFLFQFFFCAPWNHLALRKCSSQAAAAWSIFPLNVVALKWKCQGPLCTDSIVKKSTHLQKTCSKVETEQWNNHENSWSLRTRKTSDLLQCLTTKGEIWTVIWAFRVTVLVWVSNIAFGIDASSHCSVLFLSGKPGPPKSNHSLTMRNKNWITKGSFCRNPPCLSS